MKRMIRLSECKFPVITVYIKQYISVKVGIMIKLLLKMLRRILKRVLNIRLNILMWSGLLVVIALIVIWTFKSKNEENPPVIVWWTQGFSGTFDVRTCANGVKCNIVNDSFKAQLVSAYLFYGSAIDFNDLPLPRRGRDIIWGLYHEESPRNVPELLHETLLKVFNFSATFSRQSDVPFTLQYLNSVKDITSKKYFVTTADKNSLLEDLAPVLYLQSDCETTTERDAYVKELMRHIGVDSYGECLNNKQLPNKFKEDYLNNLEEDSFLKFIARYKFVVAFENGVCDDYITEKLWRALRVGSVPVYFGSPSVSDWLPNNKSAILLQDYDTVEKLANHLKDLLNDDLLYEGYLQHKLRGVISNERLINEFSVRPWSGDVLETVSEFECYICERVHDKLNGKEDVNVVSKNHYNCPKPVSALTLKVNPNNDWLYSWEMGKVKAQAIYNKISKDIF